MRSTTLSAALPDTGPRPAPPASRPSARPGHRVALATGALAVLLALSPVARADWPETPLETLGDDHRVREGQVGTPAELAADAERAAAGEVVGRTEAHDALLRARPAGPYFDAGLGDDTWIADVDVRLRRDTDGDRFYGALDLTIDVDTARVERDVYAVVELTEPDGTLTLSHATLTFAVRGNSTSDAYRIEIELFDNHPAAYRDVRIDLRDAWTDAPLDALSAFDFAALGALPLEAEHGRDPLDDPPRTFDHGDSTDYALGILLTGSSSGGHGGHHDSDAYVGGYAGAGGPFGGLALLAVVLGRLARRRKANDA